MVQDTRAPKVLLISGTVGAGKTTLAREVGEVLRNCAVTSAMIDLDCLSYVSPGDPGDRFNSRLVQKSLSAVWPNYAALGVDHLVLARFVAKPEEIDGYREAVPNADLVVCRVTAPAETVQERLRQREFGVAQAYLSHLSRQLEREVDAIGFEDFVVENGQHRSITDVAHEVLKRARWPEPPQ